jgi:tRNA G18 (ribose-2'-O)-methylase SpoU
MAMVADPIRIEHADDPRIDEFRSIRERDLVGRHGRFIAEGTVVLRMLAAAHQRQREFTAEKILILENRLAGVADILASFPDGVPVYVADSAVLDGIVGFHLHRGILAVGRRVREPLAAELIAALPENALVAAAIGISNHDNIGSIFRNAAAFGADAILLDETCCDPLYRKALRVSVGSVLQVPYARGGNMTELVGTLVEEGFAIWGLSPSGRTDIRSVPASPRMALLTGSEGHGLPPTLMERIHTASIPQVPGLDSLNAATATGIAFYQIAGAQGRI